MPNALLEFIPSGVAVVARAVGGIPEVVSDGVNGLLTGLKTRLAMPDPSYPCRVEIACADCGCVVDHGVRISECGAADCCCGAVSSRLTPPRSRRWRRRAAARPVPGGRGPSPGP
ncbi:MAG: hypothetical protein ACYDCS_13140 [Candidatus Dormibacteria bacterium]